MIVVSAEHRPEAFAACRFMIDELKAKVPIWKKEVYTDGSEWKANKEFSIEQAKESVGIAHSFLETAATVWGKVPSTEQTRKQFVGGAKMAKTAATAAAAAGKHTIGKFAPNARGDQASVNEEAHKEDVTSEAEKDGDGEKPTWLRKMSGVFSKHKEGGRDPGSAASDGEEGPPAAVPAPVSETRGVEVPEAETLAVESPAAEVPAAHALVEETSATDTSEVPAADSTVGGPETPAAEVQQVETPVADAPEVPVAGTPAAEPPAANTLAAEAPPSETAAGN